MKAVILPNQSLSDVIDLFGITTLAIQMPASWTTANLTFQACDDLNGIFVNVYDSAGNELTVVAAASRLLTDIPELYPVRYLKIRSGTSAAAIPQQAKRELVIHCK